MNLVGKIFIVLIAVMSLVFSAFAVMVYGTHTNWRQLVIAPGTGLQAQVSEAKKEYAALRRDKDTAEELNKSQLAEREQRLAKLETEVKELARAREDAIKDLASKEVTARETTAALAAKQVNEAGLLKERDKLREDAEALRADRDKQFKLVIERTDEMHQAVSEVKRLTKRNEELSGELVHARDLLTRANIDINRDPASMGPPPVNGMVLAMEGSDLIEISLGSDQGLQKGHKLEVMRINGTASTYLGRVEVVSTEPTRAVCRIDPNSRQGAIQNGDIVTSKIR